MCVCAQSRPILCDPMTPSLAGSSVHGIFQARILEWVAIPLHNIGLAEKFVWIFLTQAGGSICFWNPGDSVEWPLVLPCLLITLHRQLPHSWPEKNKVTGPPVSTGQEAWTSTSAGQSDENWEWLLDAGNDKPCFWLQDHP